MSPALSGWHELHSDADITVLYVEDSADFTDIFARQLEREDDRISVQTAPTVSTGLKHLDEHDVDCIVSNYDMPGKDGIEFLEAVREAHPDLPFFLYTDTGAESVASEAISAGVTDFFKKDARSTEYELLAERIVNAVERYWMRRAMERQNDLFEEALEIATVGAWEYDVRSDTLYSTSEALRIHGLPPAEEMSMEKSFEQYHSEDRPVVREAFERAIEAGESYDLELRLIDAEGGERWVRTQGEPQTEDGDIVRIRGTVRDITDRKQREREIERTRSRFRTLFEKAPEEIGIHDRDGNILAVNRQQIESLGYSREELTSMNVVDIEVGLSSEDVREFWEEIDIGETGKVEGEHRRNDGSTYPVEVWANKTEIDGKERFIAFARDITERKRRRRELETVLQHMDDAVFVHEYDGSFIFVNQTAVERYGYEESEFFEMTPMDLATPDETERGLERLARIRREGSLQFETEHQPASGESIPVEINANSITYRGKPAVLAIARDITDRKNRVARLEKRERILRELQTTTEAFLAAESEGEVFEGIVDGLTNALDYGFIRVRRFDSEDGALVPAATSPSLEGDFEGSQAIEPGDHPLWQAFVDGETRTIRDDQSETPARGVDASVTTVLAVPIGDEGLILLGDESDHEFGEIESGLVEMLATNAEAMLERLHRERELAELGYEITAKETRMREMETWMDTIETVHHILSERNTREAIETAVVDELIGVDAIDFTWIARPETTETDLIPGEWAGEDQGYLDGVDLAASDDLLPCQRAAVQRTRIAIPNIAEHVSEGRWAKAALSSGFRSVISIPIENDGVLYGVLTAYSSDRSGFGAMAQSFMADIASVLANAYRRVHIRTASSDAEIVELEFEIEDPSYPLLALARDADATISFDTVLETTDSTVRLLVSVDDGDPGTVLDRASSILKIENAAWFGDPDHHQLTISMAKPFVAEEISNYGGSLVASVANPGAATMRIHQSTNAPVRPTIEWLTTRYDEIDLVARRTRQRDEASEIPNPWSILTERQYEILKAAFHGGYYETPKGVTGEEIAADFDISRPAVYNHLQAAQHRLLERMFESG